MPQVAAAVLTNYFGPHHSIAIVLPELHRVAAGNFTEAWPPRQPGVVRVIFLIACKKHLPTDCTRVVAVVGILEQLAGKRPLGPLFTQHVVLLCG